MKCEIPGCQRVLKPDDTYETDKAPDAKHKPQYRRVCKKHYEKLNGEAIVQVGVGRQGSTEGKTSTAVASQLALAW